MPTSLAGSRIREARRRTGLTQAALAKKAGISPSYLNLIEHNRRRIGGRVLNAIAAALGTRASDLAEGSSPTIIADLQAAAAEHPGSPADPDTAEALAGRFPAWAEFVLTLNRQVRDQHAVIRALSDRILVMFDGSIVGERSPDTAEGELGLLMAGVSNQEAAE